MVTEYYAAGALTSPNHFMAYGVGLSRRAAVRDVFAQRPDGYCTLQSFPNGVDVVRIPKHYCQVAARVFMQTKVRALHVPERQMLGDIQHLPIERVEACIKPTRQMDQTNLETAIRSIVNGTTEGLYEIDDAPFDKREAVLDSCIDRLQDYYCRFLNMEPKNSEWIDHLGDLIGFMETLLKEEKRARDYASADDELVARAVRQGIDPEVAKRAGELQTAVRAARTDSETTRRIRTLVMPLAKEAGDEAKRGNVRKSLSLIDLAMETLREITNEAEA